MLTLREHLRTAELWGVPQDVQEAFQRAVEVGIRVEDGPPPRPSSAASPGTQASQHAMPERLESQRQQELTTARLEPPGQQGIGRPPESASLRRKGAAKSPSGALVTPGPMAAHDSRATMTRRP